MSLQIIQSKRVFVSGQFIPAHVHVDEGRISKVEAYGASVPDEDYDTLLSVPVY